MPGPYSQNQINPDDVVTKSMMSDAVGPMSNSHAQIPTSYAARTTDESILAVANSKTANRTYLNGVAQNGTAVTGDLVEWIVTKNTSGGTITDYVTTEGATRTSGGAALLSSIFSDSIMTNFIDSSGVYAQGSPTVTSNKTVSIPFTKQTLTGITVVGIPVLGSSAMNSIPDGVTIKVRLVGICA